MKLIGSSNELDLVQARHCHAPEEVWMEIVTSFPSARKNVAFNKTIPMSVVGFLSRDTDPEVRWWIAMKRKISLELIENLSNDPDPSVRERIVYNPSTPLHILQKMVFDEAENIASRAIERVSAVGA